MLKITIPASEYYDKRTKEFFTYDEVTLELEHSLVSLAAWESKWCVPYHGKQDKTTEETLDYIRCMTITPDVDPSVYQRLTKKNIEDIVAYIQSPMSATAPPKNKAGGGSGGRAIYAERVYSWMFSLNIPMECQYWHLNRLLALIRVCNDENTPPTKRSKKDIATEYARLNAERRKKLNTKG